MKKLLTLSLSVLIAIAACFSLVGCGNKKPDNDTPTQTEVSFVGAADQLSAMQSVLQGDAAFAVVDKINAEYFSKPNAQLAGLSIYNNAELDLGNEVSYGFAVKEGSGLDVVINAALYELQQTGVLATVAYKKGFDPNSLSKIPEPDVKYADVINGSYSSQTWTEIKQKGYIQLGYQVGDNFQDDPILQRSQYGSIDGLELQIFVEIYKLYGMAVKTQGNAAEKLEMLHDSQTTNLAGLNPVDELNGGTVDVLIGRVVSTTAGVAMTSTYIKDKQVAVVKAENTDKGLSFFKELKFTAKAGSVGETLIKGQINDLLYGE